MDKPKCRTCGERHRLGPCPQFAFKNPMQVAIERAASDAPLPPMTKPERRFAELLVKGVGFDRVAYQREYMRKRRAAEKAAKP